MAYLIFLGGIRLTLPTAFVAFVVFGKLTLMAAVCVVWWAEAGC